MSEVLHYKDEQIIKKVEGLFHVIPMEVLRRTDKVDFDAMPYFKEVNGYDIVKHEAGALSPGNAEGKTNLWYMHPSQEDNLVTFCGNRFVELYTKERGKIEKFEISHDRIKWNGETILDGPGILGWPKNVFHRNYSPEGSVSMNLAVRDENFNLDTEFNIYDVNIETGEYNIVRAGKEDQPS